MMNPVSGAAETIARLKDQLEAARNALVFYQNERDWKQCMFCDIDLPSRIKEDGGTVARKALAQINTAHQREESDETR